MELRTVDPRALVDILDDPRRTPAHPHYDQQLAQNIAAVGLIHPPLVREVDDKLAIVAGRRRIRAAIILELPTIEVIVSGGDAAQDGMRAAAENMVRVAMNEVDQWRVIEHLLHTEEWTEAAVCSALHLPVRSLRRLRLLANMLPAMLDRIAEGDSPPERDLATIASATLADQTAVWKARKPKRNEQVLWWQIAQALRKVRVPFATAVFDEQTATEFGVVWQEDLFAEGDTEARFTEDREAFLAAQHHWMTTHLPRGGVVLECGQYGTPVLPPHASKVWSGKPGKGDQVGVYINNQSLAIEKVVFRVTKPSKAARGKAGSVDTGEVQSPAKARPEVSGKGQEIIGQMRTAALKEAIAGRIVAEDPWRIVGALVLALASQNVNIEGDRRDYRQGSGCDRIARTIMLDGTMTFDETALRTAAGEVLCTVLSCELTAKGSGIVARVVGDAFGADEHLASMANEDFLKTLSKPGIENAIRAIGLPPRNTGKEMRAALIEQIAGRTYVHPAARFALTAAEQSKLADEIAAQASIDTANQRGDDSEDGHGGLDDGPEGAEDDALPNGGDSASDGESLKTPDPVPGGAVVPPVISRTVHAAA